MTRITDSAAHAALRKSSRERSERCFELATKLTKELLSLTSTVGMTTIERLEILHVASWVVFSMGTTITQKANEPTAVPEASRVHFLQCLALINSTSFLPDVEVIDAGKVVPDEQAN